MGFCAPLLASNLISPLLTMTDTAFVGRCAGEASAVALAALGVSTPLTDYSVSLFAFITAGLTSIVSRGVASGEDEDELNGKVYGALFIAGASSLAVGALLLARTDALLDLLSVTGEVKTIAAGYTRIRGLAMPAAFLTASAYATLVARKDTVGPLLCVALAAVVNFVGDYLMVAVFKTGAAGAAWATTASLYTGLIAITVLLHRRGLLKFPPRQNFGDGSRSFLRAMIPYQGADGADDGVLRPDHVFGRSAVGYLYHADPPGKLARCHRLRGAQNRGDALLLHRPLRRSFGASRASVHARAHHHALEGERT